MGRSRGRRLRRTLLGGAVLVAGVVAAVLATRPAPPLPPPGCVARAYGSGYALTLTQTRNAATIASVGVSLALPDHAVTVALATALQESQLYNLPYGDRDSVGLFQQRPSQGWGTRAQLLDPNYAAAAFYRRLVKVPGWRTLPVTEAAQAVQHSGAPYSYADWEAEARAMAEVFTGEVAAGLECRFYTAKHRAPDAPGALVQALGPGGLDQPVSAKRGWTVAAWLVANAQRFGIGQVSFGGRRWTNTPGTWRHASGTGSVVRVRLLPRSS